jgi:hypothetical protein
MNWLDYFSKLNSKRPIVPYQETYEVYSPASEKLLQDIKIAFGLKELPKELETLYQQTNGIGYLMDIPEHGKRLTGYCIWKAEEVLETNKKFRNYPTFKEIYMPFDQLLFISDAGNGDLFGFEVINGVSERQDIFMWDHEDDSRNWVAPNLTTFITQGTS